jgi:ankyrin repeat protein
MYKAINDGDIEELDRLVTVNRTLLETRLAESSYLLLPVHYAAFIGNTTVIEWVANQDIRLIDRKDAGGRTPLYHAASNNHCGTVETLIRLGSTALDTVDNHNFSPLHAAATAGHSTMVELLVRLGSRMMDASCISYADVPIRLAIKHGHVDVVRMLIKLGSREWNQSNNNGIQPIHVAAINGHTQIVELLIEKGVPIDVVTKDGLTPLHYAASSTDTDLIKLLIRLGSLAIDQQTTDDGSTPIMMAANGYSCNEQCVKTVEFLLKLGSKSIDTADEYSRTTINVAIHRDNAAMIECLIANGSRFLDMVDQPAYQMALKIGSKRMAFQTLLALGYDWELYLSWCKEQDFEPVIMSEEMVVDVRWRVYFRKPLVHRLLDI